MNKVLTILILFPLILTAQNAMTLNFTENDSLESKTAMLNSIFSADSVRIVASSNGCFHSKTLSYLLVKKDNQYEVSVPDDFNKKYSLNKENFNSLHQLCIHGLRLQDGGCTTRNHFIITDRKNTVNFDDARCSDNDDILNRLQAILN